MRIQFYDPHPLLAPYIAHIWTVETDAAYIPEDIRTIVPNGRLKLVFPYRGTLRNGPVGGGKISLNRENSLWVLGVSDRPWTVDSPEGHGTLAFEFFPGGAYRFFSFALKDLRNSVEPAGHVLGPAGGELESRVAEAPDAPRKIEAVQSYLLGLLARDIYADVIVDHAVALIRKRRGLVTIRELTEKLGYSQRYIAMKFDDLVGIGPKTLTEIVRFQNSLGFLSRYGDARQLENFDDGYYDQAHFSKEFKRFAGLPPAAYARASNEFLNMFLDKTISVSYKTG